MPPNRKFTPIPRSEIFAAAPRSLGGRSMLADMKTGPLVAMYARLFRKFHIRPRGIIHLGGHTGEEALPYLMLGYERVLFVEPHPESYKQLVENIRYVEGLTMALDKFVDEVPRRWVQAFQLAVGDREGTTTLYVQKNPQENSIFRPIVSRPSAHSQKVEVLIRPVDAILENLKDEWKPSDFNVLYANVQGAELVALRGARSTLKHIEFVYVEVNLVDKYEGNPTADALEDFMSDQGFSLQWTSGGLVQDIGYMVFIK